MAGTGLLAAPGSQAIDLGQRVGDARPRAYRLDRTRQALDRPEAISGAAHVEEGVVATETGATGAWPRGSSTRSGGLVEEPALLVR